VPIADINRLSRHGEVKGLYPWVPDELPKGETFATMLLSRLVARLDPSLRRSPASPDTGDRTPDPIFRTGMALEADHSVKLDAFQGSGSVRANQTTRIPNLSANVT
jgi:hypothetical protein